jgi:hypothetical protein
VIATCSDDIHSACVSKWVPSASSWQPFRLSGSTGRFTPDRTHASAPQRRAVGDGGLIDLGTRSPEKLGLLSAGRLRWSRPLSALFGSGWSTDSGWNFDLHSAQGVYSGSVGRRAPASSSSIDLSEAETIGFRAKDGRLLWRAPGVSSDCFETTIVPISTPAGDGPEYVPLWCRYQGTLTLNSAGTKFIGHRISITLERFDVESGKVVWSVPIGNAAIQARTKTGKASVVDDGHLVVDTGTSTLIIDLSTGETTPASLLTKVWCRPASKITYRIPYTDADGQSTHEVDGDGLAYPCDLQGKPVPLPSTGAPAGIPAAFADGLNLYAAPTGVVGYRMVSD